MKFSEFCQTKQASEKSLVERITRAEYDDSAEFTGELDDVMVALRKIDEIITQARFKSWMKLTDTNYDTDAVKIYEKAVAAFIKCNKAFEDLADELDSAS